MLVISHKHPNTIPNGPVTEKITPMASLSTVDPMDLTVGLLENSATVWANVMRAF